MTKSRYLVDVKVDILLIKLLLGFYKCPLIFICDAVPKLVQILGNYNFYYNCQNNYVNKMKLHNYAVNKHCNNNQH